MPRYGIRAASLRSKLVSCLYEINIFVSFKTILAKWKYIIESLLGSTYWKEGLSIDDLSYRKNSKLDIPVSLFQELSYGAIELQFELVWKKTEF